MHQERRQLAGYPVHPVLCRHFTLQSFSCILHCKVLQLFIVALRQNSCIKTLVQGSWFKALESWRLKFYFLPIRSPVRYAVAFVTRSYWQMHLKIFKVLSCLNVGQSRHGLADSVYGSAGNSKLWNSESSGCRQIHFLAHAALLASPRHITNSAIQTQNFWTRRLVNIPHHMLCTLDRISRLKKRGKNLTEKVCLQCFQCL